MKGRKKRKSAKQRLCLDAPPSNRRGTSGNTHPGGKDVQEAKETAGEELREEGPPEHFFGNGGGQK